MPRDDIARRRHNRDHPRYPGDLTDREWSIMAPFIPPARSGGRPRATDMREVVSAILHIGGGGCQWRAPPGDFPPASTARGHFHDRRDAGPWQTMNRVLVAGTREPDGREASPTAGVPPVSRLRRRIDSQSVKTTESGGVSGYDAGRKVKGRERHIITDTIGLMLFVIVHGAVIQDRDGAVDPIKAIRYRFPWPRHLFAAGACAGGKPEAALMGQGQWTIGIIKRSGTAGGTPPGRRTDLCLAWTLPATGKGSGEIDRKLNRMGKHRQHQNDDTQARSILPCLMNFRSGL